MNKKRRDQIKANIILLENIKCSLEQVLSDEEESFDNMQNFQNSLKGMDSENAIDLLNESVDSLDQCIEILKEI